MNKESNHFAKRATLVFIYSSAYLFLFVRTLWRIGDEGLIVYGADLVTAGAIPYRDFFGVMGPLSFYWLSFFFKIFGTKWVVARIVLLLTGAITSVLIYWMTRRLYSGPFDWLPATFYTMISIPLWPATSHHWDSNLFALLSVSAFFFWRDKKAILWLFVAGILAGLTSCFIQQKGLFLLIAFIASELATQTSKVQTRTTIFGIIAIIIIGYICVGASAVGFFYYKGGLDDLIYANFTFPLSQYININSVPFGFGFWEFFWQKWMQVLILFFPPVASNIVRILISIPLLTLIALPFIIIALTVVSILNTPKRYIIFSFTTLPYWFCGIGLLASELQRKDINHLIFGSPLLIVLFFYILYTLCKAKHIVWESGMAIFSFCLILLGSYNAVIASTATCYMHTRRGHIYSFQYDYALAFLNEHVDEDEEVFVYPYYSFYNFLAKVKNPTRYNNLIYDYHTEEQFLEAISDLEEKKVQVVLWDTLVENKNIKTWFPNYSQPPKDKLILEQYLENHYRTTDIRNGFRILQRKDR